MIFYYVVETSAITSVNTPIWHEVIKPIFINVYCEDGRQYSTYCTYYQPLREESTNLHGIDPGTIAYATKSPEEAVDEAAKFIRDCRGEQEAIVVTPSAFYSENVVGRDGWQWFCMMTALRNIYPERLRTISPMLKPYSLKNVYKDVTTEEEKKTYELENVSKKIVMMRALFMKNNMQPTAENSAMVGLYVNPDPIARTKKRTLLDDIIGESKTRALYELMLAAMRNNSHWPLSPRYDMMVIDLMAFAGYALHREGNIVDYECLCRQIEYILRTQIKKFSKPNGVYSDKKIAEVLCAVTDLEPRELVERNLMYNYAGDPVSYLPVHTTQEQAQALLRLGYRSFHDIVIRLSYKEEGEETQKLRDEINKEIGISNWFITHMNPAIDLFIATIK
jgi:hypothetical protein